MNRWSAMVWVLAIGLLGDNGAASQAPKVVKTVPTTGATDIDSQLDQIVVTFDIPVRQKSHSLVALGDLKFPELTGDEPVSFPDSTTCVIRVKLEPDTAYGLGINSKTRKGFKSAEDGTPAEPFEFVFSTSGKKLPANAAPSPATGEPQDKAGLPGKPSKSRTEAPVPLRYDYRKGDRWRYRLQSVSSMKWKFSNEESTPPTDRNWSVDSVEQVLDTQNGRPVELTKTVRAFTARQADAGSGRMKSVSELERPVRLKLDLRSEPPKVETLEGTLSKELLEFAEGDSFVGLIPAQPIRLGGTYELPAETTEGLKKAIGLRGQMNVKLTAKRIGPLEVEDGLNEAIEGTESNRAPVTYVFDVVEFSMDSKATGMMEDDLPLEIEETGTVVFAIDAGIVLTFNCDRTTRIKPTQTKDKNGETVTISGSGTSRSRNTYQPIKWSRGVRGKGASEDPEASRPVKKELREKPTADASTRQPSRLDNLPKELALDLGGDVKMELTLIPAGEFMMGSKLPPAQVTALFGNPEKRYKPEHPRHRVSIGKPFYLGTTEVTVGQFRRFIEETGYQTNAEEGGQDFEDGKKGGEIWAKLSWTWVDTASWKNPGFEPSDDQPVVLVSWDDAVAFCKWLSRKEGKPCRLPTEAEWEYACRAGTTTEFWWGEEVDDTGRRANVGDTGHWAKQLAEGGRNMPMDDGYATIAPVARYDGNAFGLHDMIGNVTEWCADTWHDTYEGAPSDSRVWSKDGLPMSHVIRSSAWNNPAGSCRSAFRTWYFHDHRFASIGFRVALDPAEEPLEPRSKAGDDKAESDRALADTPRVVKTEPANGEKDVEPGTVDVKIVFDQPMAAEDAYSPSLSVGEKLRTINTPSWEDSRTFVIPVMLAPGKVYRLRINAEETRKFRSSNNQPAAPFELVFSTVGAKLPAAASPAAGESEKGTGLTAERSKSRTQGPVQLRYDYRKGDSGRTTNLMARELQLEFSSGQTVPVISKLGIGCVEEILDTQDGRPVEIRKVIGEFELQQRNLGSNQTTATPELRQPVQVRVNRKGEQPEVERIEGEPPKELMEFLARERFTEVIPTRPVRLGADYELPARSLDVFKRIFDVKGTGNIDFKLTARRFAPVEVEDARNKMYKAQGGGTPVTYVFDVVEFEIKWGQDGTMEGGLPFELQGTGTLLFAIDAGVVLSLETAAKIKVKPTRVQSEGGDAATLSGGGTFKSAYNYQPINWTHGVRRRIAHDPIDTAGSRREKKAEGDRPDVSNPLVTPKASIAHQFDLLRSGDIAALRACFTVRVRDMITPELVRTARQDADKYTIEDLVAEVTEGQEGDRKTAEIKMKNGRRLTTLILIDDKWLADTVWFR